MAKSKKIINWLMYIAGLLVAIGIGGLFINGTFVNTVILNWLPAIVHTIFGWAIIVGSVIGFVMKLVK